MIIDPEISRANALAASPLGSLLLGDLATVTTNTGDPGSAMLWLLDFTSNWLKSKGQQIDKIEAGSIWPAWDFAIHDFEALDRIWPAMRNYQSGPGDFRSLGELAQFMLRRLPTIWEAPSRWTNGDHAPVTKAVHLADNIDHLASYWIAGERPTGSKDPFAMRRAALNIWRCISAPTIGDFK